MGQNKEQLSKLLELIEELSSQPGNEWFKEVLNAKYSNSFEGDSKIVDIHEYCIKLIIKTQAEQFYKDFKLHDIKEQLVLDFIRMEQFRRTDNFVDFGLAIHQQFESIVNHLCEQDLKFSNQIYLDKKVVAYRIKNQNFNLWQLILSTYKTQEDADKLFNKKIVSWDYTQKLKAVIYYYCFNQKIWDFYKFKEFHDVAHEIYMSRNLSHRGGFLYDNQIPLIDKILNEKYKCYFKFLGFLEDFTSRINANLN